MFYQAHLGTFDIFPVIYFLHSWNAQSYQVDVDDSLFV